MKATLPYPPSSNTMYFNRSFVRRGRGRVLSGGGRSFYEHTALIWAAVKARENWIDQDDRKMSVRIRVLLPDRRRRDSDNIVKAVLDSLVKGKVIKDDSQIYFHSVLKCDVGEYRGMPGVEVCIEPYKIV